VGVVIDFSNRLQIGPALGAELRAARKRRGLGLREAARRLELSHSYVASLERGERAPSAWNARRLVGVLGLEDPAAGLILGLGRRVQEGIEERARSPVPTAVGPATRGPPDSPVELEFPPS
jgi:transcriptional regulator with XRE-family HTH domain